MCDRFKHGLLIQCSKQWHLFRICRNQCFSQVLIVETIHEIHTFFIRNLTQCEFSSFLNMTSHWVLKVIYEFLKLTQKWYRETRSFLGKQKCEYMFLIPEKVGLLVLINGILIKKNVCNASYNIKYFENWVITFIYTFWIS